MQGALPPSSMAGFEAPDRADVSSFRPTAVEPVKLTTRTRRIRPAVIDERAGALRGQHVDEPLGTPASSRSGHQRQAWSAGNVFRGRGLTIMPQPAASAGAILRVPSLRD